MVVRQVPVVLAYHIISNHLSTMILSKPIYIPRWTQYLSDPWLPLSFLPIRVVRMSPVEAFAGSGKRQDDRSRTVAELVHQTWPLSAIISWANQRPCCNVLPSPKRTSPVSQRS